MADRYEDPRDEGKSGNEGVPGFPARSGPEPEDLTPEEREELLTLVRGGFGVNMALHQMRIGRYRFYRILREDPEFRSEVEHARAFDREYLWFLRRKLAVGDETKDIPPDPAGLEFLIRQGAAAERFGWERREAARTRRLAREAAARGDVGLPTAIPAPAQAVAKIEGQQWRAEQRERMSEAPSQPPPSAPSTGETSS